MKEVNLISLVNAHDSFDPNLCQKYFEFFKVNLKDSELEDLKSYVEQLKLISPYINVFDKYFLGYTIPQISKEFDLLRFGKDDIVNVELKREGAKDKIEKQLIENNYYLKFLEKDIHCFTYVSSKKKLYSLDDNLKLVETDFKELDQKLSNQKTIEILNIDNLFNPSNYLVSPFNSTEAFIKAKYFLTDHQKNIKKEVIKNIKDETKAYFFPICGGAGTGKTLLTYDIAKEYIDDGSKVLIIHCGLLNEGHKKLRDKYNWDIIPIKKFKTIELSDYYLVVIDEAQRIRPDQLDFIIKEIQENNSNCIFSYDEQQCLRIQETKNDIPQRISNKTSSRIHQLTKKIRTNKEIASFIIALFDKTKPVEKLDRTNIGLTYFQDDEAAKKYIELLKEEGWKIINYTPSILRGHNSPYNNYSIPSEDNAHAVIGQEFDKVVAVIDQHFYYSGNELKYRCSSFYHPIKMLFQIMTRARRKLSVIIIDNKEIMERCLSIIDENKISSGEAILKS